MIAMRLTMICLITAVTAFATTIRVEPSTQTVVRQITYIGINVNIDDVADLYAFQFDITFVPTILSVFDVSDGMFLSGIFSPGVQDNTTGSVASITGSVLGAGPGVTGSGKLASIIFRSFNFGTSPIKLSNVVLLDSALNDIPSTVISGTASVIPEPSTLALLIFGIVAVIRSRKLNKT